MSGAFRFCPLCGMELAPLATGPDRGRPACPTGHFVRYDNPAVTTLAFVQHGTRHLLLRRAAEPFRGQWDLPGGFVEADESPGACVRREIHEETGLSVDRLSLIGVYTSRYGGDGKATVDIAYTCRADRDEVTVSEEKSDFAWLHLDDFPELAFAGERAALVEMRQRSRQRLDEGGCA